MITELKKKIALLTEQATDLIAGEELEALDNVLQLRQTLIEQLWQVAIKDHRRDDVEAYLSQLIEQDSLAVARLKRLKQQLDTQERIREKSQKNITQYLTINKYR